MAAAFARTTWAQPVPQAVDVASESPSGDASVPTCLDQSITDALGHRLKRRGVQKREFLKQGKAEILAHGGLFASDLLSSSYIAGGAAAIFFTEDLGIEIDVDVTPIALKLDEPVADFFGDDRFETSLGLLGTASVLWAPIHAKLKSGDHIVHADVLFSAGAGKLFHDSAQGIAASGGLAIELLFTSWLTFRIDARDVIVIQEAVAETRVGHNIALTGGLGLWFPTGL